MNGPTFAAMSIREFTTELATGLQGIYPEPECEAIAALATEYLLGLDPLQRRMHSQEAVDPAVAASLPELLRRLQAHEPVQYVLGVAHFAGMELEVSLATLIPRPETEELVALVARDWVGRTGLRLLDVGTGSGCLVLALAQALQPAQALAVDISEAALAVAQRNGGRFAPQVQFQQLDILREVPPVVAGTLDILVSNPPYVRDSERSLMRANVLDWEPATALFVPDHDPLLFYRRIGELGRNLLRPGGRLYFEINEAFGPETVALLTSQGYATARAVQDMFGKARMVVAVNPA